MKKGHKNQKNFTISSPRFSAAAAYRNAMDILNGLPFSLIETCLLDS